MVLCGFASADDDSDGTETPTPSPELSAQEDDPSEDDTEIQVQSSEDPSEQDEDSSQTDTADDDTNSEEEEEEPPPPTTEALLKRIELSTMGIPIRLHEDVIEWIDWFRGPGRYSLILWIKRSGKYRKMIQMELQKAGLPRELLYLAMIESGFVETAESHASAVGVWQFIPSTGQRYNLRVDEQIDERRDPYLSTQAAIQYLQFLYHSFGYWPAAMAAYNAGEGKVHSALFQYGTIDYWVLSDSEALPEETIGYVPKILAAAIIDTHPAVFGFQGIKKEDPIDLVRVMVNGGTHIALMADAAGLELEQFQNNNPHILSTRLPSDRAEYHVYVPPAVLNNFTREMRRMGVDRISSGRSMSEAEIAQYAAKENVSIGHHARRFNHVVVEGETIESISQTYRLSEETLLRWNSLSDDGELQIGQTLRLKAPTEVTRTKWVPHDVKRGDSLKGLARRYDCQVEDIMNWNQLENERIPAPGTRLWIKTVVD